MNNQLVKINELVKPSNKTDSFIIAEKFGKRHCDVLRVITNTRKKLSQEFTERNFALSEYLDNTGRKLPYYEITKDGFLIIAMGFTSPEAFEWKEKFIAAFNRMESVIKQNLTVPASINTKAVSTAVKRCVTAALKQELSSIFNNPTLPDLIKTYEPLSDEDMLRCLRNWYFHHHYQTVKEQQRLFEENALLRSKLDTIHKTVLLPIKI